MAFYLQHGSGGLVPELHPDWDVINLRWWRSEVQVLQTWSEELGTVGLQELYFPCVVVTCFISWAGDSSMTSLKSLNADERFLEMEFKKKLSLQIALQLSYGVTIN